MTTFLAIRAFLGKLPWWAYAILASLAVVWLAYRMGYNARDKAADAEMAAVEANYARAQAEALAAANAAREATEARYRALAQRSDANAVEARNAALSAADRHIIRNRVQPCAVGSAGSAAIAAASDNGSGDSQRSGADTIVDAVAVSADDVRICSDNTARLQAVREWGLALGEASNP